ncbi:hypothetical protein [Vibrio sp. Vb339]|uniref:hypothetical protein n=1 Tax=Vibrio sp. Vb339 TaxID=1192013 RepID=UPI0015562FFC|nr:hypothetical protein [Vibrio sp. Vb339]
MTDKTGIKACYDALERLKNGEPLNEKFIGLTLDRITASVVSQEAGYDSGYLKRARINHQAIIAMIDSTKACAQNNISTLSKSEIIRREKKRSDKLRVELERTRQLLEESLSREVLLAHKLVELERRLLTEFNMIDLR